MRYSLKFSSNAYSSVLTCHVVPLAYMCFSYNDRARSTTRLQDVQLQQQRTIEYPIRHQKSINLFFGVVQTDDASNQSSAVTSYLLTSRESIKVDLISLTQHLVLSIELRGERVG